MNTVEIKQQLHRYIERADDRMAKALLAMLKNYFQRSTDQQQLCTIDGKVLNKAAIIEEVMSAVNDVQKGNFLTTEQLRNRFNR
ncbi:MAG: hypothetical protein AB8G22_29545 [Saprospiraceae bacterium]